jgi:hypothetical protein
MSDRDTILPDLDTARSDVGSLGLRRYAVKIRQRVWSGGYVGLGTPTDTDLPITPQPKVEALSVNEIAASGGTYLQGDRRISGMTPYYAGPPSGGYTPAQLSASLGVSSTNIESMYVLVGDEGESHHTVVQTFFDKPFSYRVVVRQRRDTP